MSFQWSDAVGRRPLIALSSALVPQTAPVEDDVRLGAWVAYGDEGDGGVEAGEAVGEGEVVPALNEDMDGLVGGGNVGGSVEGGGEAGTEDGEGGVEGGVVGGRVGGRGLAAGSGHKVGLRVGHGHECWLKGDDQVL